MRAVRIHARQDMRTEQVPSPEPAVGEVRLRVGYVGICGSDLHYYADGAAGIFAIREPLIPGHEVSGVIDLDPTGVWAAGTPVTVHPATWGAAQPDLSEEQRQLWPGGGWRHWGQAGADLWIGPDRAAHRCRRSSRGCGRGGVCRPARRPAAARPGVG